MARAEYRAVLKQYMGEEPERKQWNIPTAFLVGSFHSSFYFLHFLNLIVCIGNFHN